MKKVTKNICLISPLKGELSETFIKSHFDNFKCNIFNVYGDYPDLKYKNYLIKDLYTLKRRLGNIFNILPHFIYWRIINKDIFKKSFLRFLKEKKINIVFAEYGWIGAIYYEFAKELKIPLIIHFYGIDAYQKSLLETYKNEYREMFKYASFLITVSHDMSEKLISLGADKKKIIYNPCAPNPIFYNIDPVYTDTFLAIGRFTETKCPHHTILAFKLVVDEFPDSQLIMIGNGVLYESSINFSEALGLSDKILFTGKLNHEETVPYMKKACCFVQHSITTLNGDSEGTPVAILEAGAAGLPVVSTNHAGIKDSVIHEKTGFLVNEKDIYAMATYMKKLIVDKELCKKMGNEARIHIKKNYDYNKHISRLQELIDNL